MNELQNRTKRIKRWMIAALLCICMIMTLIPVEYYGLSIADPGETAQTTQREILSFTELPAEISAQMVDLGTPLGELALPSTLTAICRLDPGALEPEISTETETPSEETEETETGETETPDASETETPNVPDSSETETPDTPDSSETNTPDAPDSSETNTPDAPDSSETNTPDAPDSSETSTPDTPATPNEGSDEPSGLPEQPEEANPPQEAPDTAPASEPSPETAAPNDDLTVETTTVTIKENYAMPEDMDRLKELILNDPAAALEEQGTETVTISGISWRSEPPYDGETEGVYCFTPILPPGYALSEGAILPEILVTVGENGLLALAETEEEEDLTPTEPACGIVSRDITWEKAGTLANGELIIKPGVTLTITNKLDIEGTVTILGGGTILRGSENAYFSVSDGSLALQNITLEGASNPSPYSMIEVYEASVTLNDGCKILNCTKNVSSTGSASNAKGGAALLVERGGTANLNNAEIAGCSAALRGGAIYTSGSAVTIQGGSYSGNSTTLSDTGLGGGFLFNDTSTVSIYGGSFLNNCSAGRGGCIYHGGNDNTATHLYGGYFAGNQSSYPGNEGSGAIWNSSEINGSTMLSLSGGVQFAGAGSGSGTDGIYLDSQKSTPRKIYITNVLSSQIQIYLEAAEGYVIAEGSAYNLEERDMKKITFIDTGNSGKKWYAKLENNQVKTVSTDPGYGLYVTYHSNGAEGQVKDENSYKPGDTVTIMPPDGLTLDKHFFFEWNTVRDGSNNGSGYAKDEKIIIEQDLDLFAIFLPDCSATFYSGGANQSVTISSRDDDDNNSNGYIQAPELKPIAGYTAVGWDRDPNGYIGSIKPGTPISLTEDTSFYGVYKKEITLTFDPKGGTVTRKTKFGNNLINVHQEISRQNHKFALDPEVSRSGHVCSGWTEAEDNSGILYQRYQREGDPKYEFEQNTTLYAYWHADGEPSYIVEHYKQNITDDGYTLYASDTQNLSAAAGTTVLAEARNYDGFAPKTAYQEGVVTVDNPLTFKFYYDRNTYNISFDLNGADGVAPDPQNKVRYGDTLKKVEMPTRTGYLFRGWYKNKICSDESLWDFDSPVEANVTLFAKWEDVDPPELGTAKFNNGYKNLLNWIVRKKDLIITIPITDEGSGVKEANYTLEPDGAPEARSRSPISQTVTPEPENGQTVIKIHITEDFKGKITVTGTDNAGNTSPETSLTAEDGGIIVEDSAPKIRFSYEKPGSSGYYHDSVKVTVFVEDVESRVLDQTGEGKNADDDTNSRVSGGIADIYYQINDADGQGEEIHVSAEKGFDEGIVTSCIFDVEIDKLGMPTLYIDATDHAGNHSWRQISLDIRSQRTYRIEHYTQDANGETYTKESSETKTLTVTDPKARVTATPKSYLGFFENTKHADRIASGIAEEDGSLVLKLYYDRIIYDISFDLNGASGTAPNRQFVRCGNMLQTVEPPTRTGYEFKGWYLDAAGTDGMQWNFSRPVERNAAQATVTLYAKWADELAPVLGNTSYNKGYRRVLDYIIRKPDLMITVPITEEGSGVKQADYVLMPDEGSLKEGKAKIVTENGQTVAKFSIKKDFSGSVALSATDNAGNVSAEKILTPEEGGIIVEGNAPEITFSTKNGSLSETFSDSVTVDVSVKDISRNRTISGGIANVTYQIDDKEYDTAKEVFEEEILESYEFTVNISTTGEHVLSVTASDHAGNKSTRKVKVNIQATANPTPSGEASDSGSIPETSEPKTGDSLHIELYVTIAMIAGLLYLILLFGFGRTKMTQDDVQRKIKRLSRWAKNGGQIRKLMAMTAVFFLLAYYNSIGKASNAKRNDAYGR